MRVHEVADMMSALRASAQAGVAATDGVTDRATTDRANTDRANTDRAGAEQAAREAV
jgi:hypothetical protein